MSYSWKTITGKYLDTKLSQNPYRGASSRTGGAEGDSNPIGRIMLSGQTTQCSQKLDRSKVDEKGRAKHTNLPPVSVAANSSHLASSTLQSRLVAMSLQRLSESSALDQGYLPGMWGPWLSGLSSSWTISPVFMWPLCGLSSPWSILSLLRTQRGMPRNTRAAPNIRRTWSHGPHVSSEIGGGH